MDRLESPTPTPTPSPDRRDTSPNTHGGTKLSTKVDNPDPARGAMDPPPRPSSLAPLVTTPSRQQPALARKSVPIAPKAPNATLPAQYTSYLEAFEDLRQKTRQLGSDLSCLRGEFVQPGVPGKDQGKLFADAGYEDLRALQKTENNITKIMKRISNRERNSAGGRGSTHAKDLESDAAIDKESLEVLTAEHKSKKEELTDLRLKLEALNPHQEWRIHEYDSGFQYQLIGNQVMLPEYRRPGPKLIMERNKARKRTSEEISRANSVAPSPQGTPEPTRPPTRRASKPAGQHPPNPVFPSTAETTKSTSRSTGKSAGQFHTFQSTSAPIQPSYQSFPQYSNPYHPPTNASGSTPYPAGNAINSLSQARPPPAKRSKLAVSMHSNPDIMGSYANDIQFWIRQAEQHRNIINSHQHSIADHKNQVEFHQNQIAMHQNEIAVHEKGVADKAAQLNGVIGQVTRKMSECSGAVLDVANQQRRNIEEHAANAYPDYTQVEAFYQSRKQACDNLDRQYAVKEGRNTNLVARHEAMRKELDARDTLLKEIEDLKASKAAHEANPNGGAGVQHNGNAQVQQHGNSEVRQHGVSHAGNPQVQPNNTEAEVQHNITVARHNNAESQQTGGSHTG